MSYDYGYYGDYNETSDYYYGDSYETQDYDYETEEYYATEEYYYEEAAPVEAEEESAGMGMAGMAYLLVPVLDLAAWGVIQFVGKQADWATAGYVALAGGAVKLIGVALYMGMGMNLYIPAVGIAQSIALIVFTFLANGKTADSTNMILGYSAGGLGVILGAYKTMMMMGGDADEEMVEDEYYADYYYADEYAEEDAADEYADEDYYGYGDDYYGDDYYSYDYYGYGDDYYGDDYYS